MATALPEAHEEGKLPRGDWVRARTTSGELPHSAYPLSLVSVRRFRSARSGQGRTDGAAKRTLDGEDRSDTMRVEGEGGRRTSKELHKRAVLQPPGAGSPAKNRRTRTAAMATTVMTSSGRVRVMRQTASVSKLFY